MHGDPAAAPAKASVDYSIEPYGPAIGDAYAALFSDSPEKLAELDWRFGQPAHGPARFAIARQDGAIVGMIALVPTLLRGQLGELSGVQAIDTIVSPAARGKFIFIRLGKIVHESPLVDADLVWGFPNALAARGWFGKLGWARFGTVPFLIKPLRSGYFLGRLWNPLRRLDLPLGFPSKDDPAIVTRMDDRWDRLWDMCRDEFGIAVDRSAQWMRWRLDKPNAGYRFAMKIGPDGAEAAVVTRIARKHGATICYVMEALAPSGHRRSLDRLLKSEMRRAARHGADLALAWCPSHAPNRKNYARAGFFGLPDRLRPIQIHFGARWLAPGEALGRPLPGNQWYLSYLDSDTV
jgi:hypothetical protein